MTNPTSSESFVPVTDVSRHQGDIDFNVMKAKGVRGLILRASHGSTRDQRVDTYYPEAISAGFDPADIGFYTFINPKRGSATDTASTTVAIIDDITGSRDEVLYMLDVEDYTNESPDEGNSPVSGSQFGTYLRDHCDEFKRRKPNGTVIAYSNRAYWDSPLGPRDRDLATELEWIVPRYPLFSDAAYESRGFPPAPGQWHSYAFQLKQEGPISPDGATWCGWQFSAGFNKQGAVYGCTSRDLDLNCVHELAWNRWTRSVQRPDAAPSAPDQPPAPRTTVVQPGEGWIRIARRILGNDDRWREIARINGGEDRPLHPGDVITLPSDAAPSAPDQPPAPRTTVVQPGEGWIRIARRILGNDDRWREIARINGGEDRVLHPGDLITLPT